MSYQNPRHALEERDAIDERTKPLFAKVGRGERLSGAEQRQLAQDNLRLADLNEVIRGHNANAAASAAAASSINAPGIGSDADRSSEERAWSQYLLRGTVSPELRAAGEASGSTGGYLVPPGWWQRLQVAMKAYGGTMADFELIETDTGQPMQWATTDPTTVVGSQIAENTQVSEQDYVFGQGTLSAYAFTGGVQRSSKQLAQDSAFNLDQFVQARVAESLGRAEAAASISGSGSGQPLGIITALAAATTSGSGGTYTLTTATKVNVLGPGTGTSTTGSQQLTELIWGTLSPASFLAMTKAVDRAYRAQGAKFYMPDTVLKAAQGIVDGYGQPFYPSLQDDMNPKLLGYDVVVDNNIPALTASTASGVIFGHLPSAMVLRRVRGGELMRLEERYADFLQIGFIGWERIDIRSNDLRAAVVAVPGAS